MNRSAGRNVHIYNPNDLTTPLGSLIVTNGMTNASFYTMVEVFLLFDSNYVLRHEDFMDAIKDVRRDEQALQPSNYYVITSGKFLLCVDEQIG